MIYVKLTRYKILHDFGTTLVFHSTMIRYFVYQNICQNYYSVFGKEYILW